MSARFNTVVSTPRISSEDFDAAAREAELARQEDAAETQKAVELDTASRCERDARVVLPFVLVTWASVWTGAALAIYTPMESVAVMAIGGAVMVAGLLAIAARKYVERGYVNESN